MPLLCGFSADSKVFGPKSLNRLYEALDSSGPYWRSNSG